MRQGPSFYVVSDLALLTLTPANNCATEQTAA
jgi:hypothetical protein